MIKLGTIGMLDKFVKSFPNIKAHAAIKNGYVGTIDFATKKTAAPTTTTKKTAELFIAMNTVLGDAQYTDATILADEYVNLYSLKEFADQTLTFDEGHITYAEGVDYSDIVANTTKLGVGTDGKFEIVADVTGYAMYFIVREKIEFNGNGVTVQIVLV